MEPNGHCQREPEQHPDLCSKRDGVGHAEGEVRDEASAKATGHGPVYRVPGAPVDLYQEPSSHQPERHVGDEAHEANVQGGLQQLVVGMGHVEVGSSSVGYRTGITLRNPFMPMPVIGTSWMAAMALDQSSTHSDTPPAMPGPDWLMTKLNVLEGPSVTARTTTAAAPMVARTRVARPCQMRNAAVATKSPAQAPRDCISSKAPVVRTKVITWMGMRHLPRSRPQDAANNERCEPVTSRATCRGTNKTRQPATAFGLNPSSAPGTPRIALGNKAETESSAGNFGVHWVPSSARTARPAPASRNATVPPFNLSDVVSQRVMAQNNSAPRATLATCPG